MVKSKCIMRRFRFKTWLVVVLISPFCFLVLFLLAAFISRYSYDREFAQAAVWANNMTASVLYNKHQWDFVRILTVSKDGHYFIVEGSVDSEASLKDLHSKLENPPPYIGPAPIFMVWDVQVKTNGIPMM